jgi:hypothetical protein
MIKEVKEAIHPKTKELYRVGDIVCIYQGRFGHNNIITIKSMWVENEGEENEYIYVSERDTLPGTGLYEVKHKMTPKLLKEIEKAKSLKHYL